MPFLHKKIDTDALVQNWRTIRRRATARHLLAVVKSDAYGHGLLTVGAALAPHADGFAVARLPDALKLRAMNATSPIVVMHGMLCYSDALAFPEYRLSPTVYEAWHLSALSTLPADAGLTVYLKVNTGMNRLGFSLDDAAAALDALKRTAAVEQIILMTHFADADRAHGIDDAINRLSPLRQVAGLPVSLGNSAATLLHGDIGDDWARVGIALYGASPAPQWRSRDDLNLTAVMTVSAPLLAVRHLAEGDRVGYGGEYVAARPHSIGIVGGGYGDGYPRGSAMTAFLRGVPVAVLGRVSMEMLAVDLSAVAGAEIGDEVILWGRQPSVDDVAEQAGMIAYDLLTATMPIPPKLLSQET